MLKKLSKNITIINVIIFVVVILVGGVSIVFSSKILHNSYKIQKMSEHIILVDGIHATSFQFLLDIHHFLIDPNEIFAQSARDNLNKIEKELDNYIKEETAELYGDKYNKNMAILISLKKDIQHQKGIFYFFDEFSKKGTFDKNKFIGMEDFGNEIEEKVGEINRVHFNKIVGYQKDSLTYMWIIMILYIVFITFGVTSVYLGHRILTRKVVNPIKELSSATIEFSEGTFDKRVFTDSRTEIGLLYQSFNKMADKLQDHNELLRKFNEELERKVKERTLELQEANEQLQRTQGALIRAEKIAAVGQIAAGVTHEIKNPLNSLAINIQMLQKQIKETVETDECGFSEMAYIIQCEVKRINNILDNFVWFAKFPDPKFMQNDLNQTVKEVTAFISPEAKGAGVTIDLSLSDSIPEFKFDNSQVKEILMNLTRNAFQAMPHGGELKISTSASNNKITINVSDTGIGIPEGNLVRLFTPFFSTKDSGFGLGLAIVKRIVEGHGGRISCRSKAGEGTVFEIVFPVEKD